MSRRCNPIQEEFIESIVDNDFQDSDEEIKIELDLDSSKEEDDWNDDEDSDDEESVGESEIEPPEEYFDEEPAANGNGKTTPLKSKGEHVKKTAVPSSCSIGVRRKAKDDPLIDIAEEFCGREPKLKKNGQSGDFDMYREPVVLDPGALSYDVWMLNESVATENHGRAVKGDRMRGRKRGICGRGVSRVRRGCDLSGALGNPVWVEGEEFMEVYRTDDDIPLELRERLVKGAECARRATAVKGERENDASKDELMCEYERFCADEKTGRFDWKPMNSFQGSKEQFCVENTGPTRVFRDAYDAFREIWDDAALQHIVDCTNAYALSYSNANEEFRKHWYNTNIHEVLILFTFWIMLGIVRMPSINSCFSTDLFLKTNIFRLLFSRKRYWSLNNALRFALNCTLEQNSDKLHHIRPIIDILNEKFKQCYVPTQDICIDESLTLWKGKLSFRQYIKSKAAKLGIKSYELCESATGYLWSFFLYNGKSTVSEPKLQNKRVMAVLNLIRPLLHKGYRVFMDGWYNSPLLARFLKRNKTDCVGTLNRTLKHIPPVLTDLPFQKGSYIARHAGDVVLISTQDRKPLLMISTHHGTTQVKTVKKPGHPSKFRFSTLADYNVGMGGTDRKAQMLEFYMIERKQCILWFKKMFKRLLNISIINSRILVDKTHGNKIEQLNFRLKLVKALVQNHLHMIPRKTRSEPHSGRGVEFSSRRLLTRPEAFHFPRRRHNLKVGQCRTTGVHRQAIGRVRCVWCAKRDRPQKPRKTVYECSVCEEPLCLEECFHKYHTVP